MQNAVDKILNRTISDSDIRYYIHSSHDTQLWNVLEFLQPVGYDPLDMPYASTIFLELHYDENCLNNPKTRGTQCFEVHAANNG